MNLDYAVKEPNSLWITYNQQKTECYEHEQEKCLIETNFNDLPEGDVFKQKEIGFNHCTVSALLAITCAVKKK